ncbi:hypothetical protein [Aquimarina rhabdastrellae]
MDKQQAHKDNHLHHLVIKIVLVLLIGGILQSCKSYVQYRPTKKDQRKIMGNWLTTRKKIAKAHDQEDTLYIALIHHDSIQYYLEHRRRFPTTIEEKDSLFFYDNFFNKTLIPYKKYNPSKKKEKKKGIVIVDKEEFFSNEKVNKITYPLFSQDGKTAILYGSGIRGMSAIRSYRKKNKKWISEKIFIFY